jgi:hypothetical protein
MGLRRPFDTDIRGKLAGLPPPVSLADAAVDPFP